MSDETLRATRRSLLAGLAVTAAAGTAAAGTTRAGSPPSRGHVVLLGDSIFDNKAYVDDGPDVIAQLRAALPSGWTATLAAVDGSTTVDIARQMERIPDDATHLVVSAGGNDALGHRDFLEGKASTVGDVLGTLAKFRAAFAQNYRAMLDAVHARKLPTAICTIYDPNYDEPAVQRAAVSGLAVFNDAITRAAFARGLPLIDLRLIFDDGADYANPIEPSSKGGAKIAKVITEVVTSHDFRLPRSVVYRD
jgi:lysophospholipase L1-like esterase